jgi:hypothetical protein
MHATLRKASRTARGNGRQPSRLLREPVLSPEAIETFDRQGFLHVPGVIPAGDVARIRGTLELLLGRFDTYSHWIARDLAHVDRQGGRARIPEISRIAALAPGLTLSAGFSRCRAIATALLRCHAHYRSDHAIYKPPRNGSDTPWHQDAAYGDGGQPETVHFWLALQDTSRDMGCLEFIPGSHLGPVQRHQRRTAAAETLMTDPGDPRNAVAVPLRAGDVTIHHPRTLHYSGPNTTDEPRLAWILHFSTRASSLQLLVDPPDALTWTKPLVASVWRLAVRLLP